MQKLINAKRQNFNVDKENQIISLWQNKSCPNRAIANIPAQSGGGGEFTQVKSNRQLCIQVASLCFCPQALCDSQEGGFAIAGSRVSTLTLDYDNKHQEEQQS